MKQTRKNKGFTMAEVLIVVAIIVILAGVGFVNIIQHQRSLHRVEMDGIAKEIFVAAQNHLTMADSQGLLNGKATGESCGEDSYYFRVGPDSGYPDSSGDSVLDLMLPFGSIDETIRLGGEYVISYQYSTAKVLNVFYAEKTGRYAHTFSEDYNSLVQNYAGDNKTSARENDGVGWYGGESGDTIPVGDELSTPEIKVVNAERLLVEINNPNNNNSEAKLKLLIKGKNSGKEFAIDANGNNKVVLDDITSSDAAKHFAGQFTEFYPGEDIEIQAVAFSNKAYTNIAYSSIVTTNSLFAAVTEKTEENNTTVTAKVANFRHLENLYSTISGIGTVPSGVESSLAIKPTNAEQISDMNWETFLNKVGSASAKVYEYSVTSSALSGEGKYVPIKPKNELSYDGKNHKISKVQIETNGNAGLFESLNAGTVENIQLLDFDVITGNGNAGALVGEASGTTIENIVVRNTLENDAGLEINGGKNSGGLVGVLSGGSVTDCAAAVYVQAKNNAGGLIGQATGTVNVSTSYSGGHTYNGQYSEAASSLSTGDDLTRLNVQGSNSGGLIGVSDGIIIEDCYSTCSVKGTDSAGGLIGSASDDTVKNCYSTGLVLGDSEDNTNAFIGSGNVSAGTGSDRNYYYAIINESMQPGGGADSAIQAIDESAYTYNTFVGDTHGNGAPYDTTLTDYYPEGYPFRTVKQLSNESGGIHYGDWPSPEVFFINTAASTPSPTPTTEPNNQ